MSATSLLLILALWLVSRISLGTPAHDTTYRPALAAAIAVYGVVLLGYIVRRAKVRWRWSIPLFLVYYLGVEHFAARHLIVPLRMRLYYQIRDPDHRPRMTSPALGWNSDSLRCPHESMDFTDSSFNVLFLGDSYTFGLRLKPGQCFPRLVEGDLRRLFPELEVMVANFAWTSSSPLLSWRRLIDIGEKYRPDVVVLCLDMTDFRDDIRWDNMLTRRGIYGYYDVIPLVLRAFEALAPELFWKVYNGSNDNMPAKRFFASEAPLGETRPFLQPTAKNLDRIDAWCREHGAHFILVVLPRTYQYSDRECPDNWEAEEYAVLGPHSLEPFRFFEELEPEVDFPIHSLLETFRATEVFPTAFRDDPHWTPAGSRVAATAITEILSAEIELLQASSSSPK